MVHQPHITNAYLESGRTVLIKLSDSVVLPCSVSSVTVTDTTAGLPIPVAFVDTPRRYTGCIVSNFQHILSAAGDWNTQDQQTLLCEIHRNLYQLTVRLPAGKYEYKVAFDGYWNGAFPLENVSLSVPYGGSIVTFSYVPFDPVTHQPAIYDSINQPSVSLPLSSAGVMTDTLLVDLKEAPDLVHLLKVAYLNEPGYPITPRNILNEEQYIYSGDDLGVVFAPEVCTFRVWSPAASDIRLLLFDSETGPLTQEVSMKPDVCGTWFSRVEQELENWYYMYEVTIHGVTSLALDPYGKAIAPNATRVLIVDLAKTNPDDWSDDCGPSVVDPVNAVIYELHVRDFSIYDGSGLEHKGQYLAFTERNTREEISNVSTGVDSLLELGITHVQLLPVAEFASVDENRPDQYNWGYDPRNYNVPEGVYATTSSGTARIVEYKQLIQALHQEHIGVIMDVVYNHTFSMRDSDFDKLVPQYYYRTADDGQYTNGSGVGNELATERPMVQKFVLDSLRYWVQEYHVDGFRFDLMALLGINTMKRISTDLHQVKPDILLYGEPWTGGSSALPMHQLVSKGMQKGLKLGVFNDHLRGGLVGSVFVHAVCGFVSGEINALDVIKQCVTGSISIFTAFPSETVNYASCHDNLTLWDKLMASNGQDSEADRILMQELAIAIVVTSQGVPFIHGGDEILRTKNGCDNSYNQGDAINQFDWSRKALYQHVFSFCANLIHLRLDHPAFRMTTAEQITNHLHFLDQCPPGLLAFQLIERANGDDWRTILVAYNPLKNSVALPLSPGMWTVVCTQGRCDEKGLQMVEDCFTIPRISCAILYQE